MAFTVAFLLLLIANIGQAQPIIESSAQYVETNLQTTHTSGSITTTGTNRAILILVTSEQTTPVDKSLTSVQFDTPSPESFSEVISVGTGAFANFASIWYLPNPSIATDTITWVHANSVRSEATIVVLSNAQQSALTLTDSDTCDGCGNPDIVTMSITTTVANTMLFTLANSNLSGSTFTCGDGQTEIFEIQGGSNVHVSTYENKVEAGQETLTCTSSNGFIVVGVSAGVAPIVAPPATPRRLGKPPRFQ